MSFPATDYAKLASVARILCADAVERAQSGHPGAPLGMADFATVLWHSHLKMNPANPSWHNRDRFVLSNGHASALLYVLLHLSGFGLTIEDLRQFRQLHSRTPGHPERGCTEGVEVTTGPLGQGFANAVGMALSERILAQRFNLKDFQVVDHHTYVFVGDGCMMEGISHEAASFAGARQLSKLIVFYDDNDISIDGRVSNWIGEKVDRRFAAYGWHIQSIDGHDYAAIDKAIKAAKEDHSRPSLICCKTIIGKGCPLKCNSEKVHGAPLGEAGIASLRENLNWEYEPFFVPSELYQSWSSLARGSQLEIKWRNMMEVYRKQHADLYAEYNRCMECKLPSDWTQKKAAFIDEIVANNVSMATRKASQKVLDSLAPIFPEMIGGSADLTSSNLTRWEGAEVLNNVNYAGRYIHYGVREFAMTAIQNGMFAHGGVRPFAGTFLVFHDYARSAVRLAAMMELGTILVYSHDSIAVGEDGPTHQPVEQLAALRLIPNLHVWRPCDPVETAIAWISAVEQTTAPTALVLSRQNVDAYSRSLDQLELIHRGGYVLDDDKRPEFIMIASGSEVTLAINAADLLRQQGKQVRVVSIPCLEMFLKQDLEYQTSVLPPRIEARLAIEMGSGTNWDQIVGPKGTTLQQTQFGASGPCNEVLANFGFTADAVVAASLNLLDN